MTYELKSEITMIDEENSSIVDTGARVYYILKHIVYDKPNERESYVLGSFMLEILQDISMNAEGVDNVIRGLMDKS